MKEVVLKKINFKVIGIIVSLILFESIFYLLAKLTPFNVLVLGNNIDNQLPFISEFIYFYIYWYLLLFLIPYVVYLKNENLFYKYISIFIFCVIISTIIFFLLPTTLERPEIIVNDLDTFILNLIYSMDNPALNCFPSMHCAICFLFIYISYFLEDLKWYYKTFFVVSSILVIVSTLLIKQHVIIDVIGAFILCFLSIIFTQIFKFDNKVKKIAKSYLLP